MKWFVTLVMCLAMIAFAAAPTLAKEPKEPKDGKKKEKTVTLAGLVTAASDMQVVIKTSKDGSTTLKIDAKTKIKINGKITTKGSDLKEGMRIRALATEKGMALQIQAASPPDDKEKEKEKEKDKDKEKAK